MKHLLATAATALAVACAPAWGDTVRATSDDYCVLLQKVAADSRSGLVMIEGETFSQIDYLERMTAFKGKDFPAVLLFIEGVCHHKDPKQGEILDWATGERLLP